MTTISAYSFHLPISSSLRRHHRRRRQFIPTPSSDQTPTTSTNPTHLKLTIDIPRYDSNLRNLIHSGTEAFEDLQTLVSLDEDRRIVVSCRRETLTFAGNVTAFVLVVVLGFRVLVKLGFGLRERLARGGESGLVYRRDRSLGGKQVLVGKIQTLPAPRSSRVLGNPLSEEQVEAEKMTSNKSKGQRPLPGWWPDSLPPPVATDDKQEYQRMADRLIRAYQLDFQQFLINE